MLQGADRRLFVVGLGNPGRQYAATRHNVGFRVVEALCRRWDAGAPRNGFGSLVAEARPSRPDEGQRRVVLVQPQRYMNRSGSCVREMAAFYQAEPGDVLAVLDDMALPVGRLRVRAEGSSGGHKGLADILAAMGTTWVPRLRIGIGAAPAYMDAADYVLAAFGESEREEIDAAVAAAATTVEDWVFHGTEYVMAKYNRASLGDAEERS
jgi:PTH1 family peptidyl-tRNA hydrolase